MRFATVKTVVEHTSECPYCFERVQRLYLQDTKETQESACRHYVGLVKRNERIEAAFSPKGKK